MYRLLAGFVAVGGRIARDAPTVGVKAVQEAVAAKAKYGCTEAMVVTNSTFTRQAQELARVNGVTLWDRDRLVKALLSVNKDRAIVSDKVASAREPLNEPATAPTAATPGGMQQVTDASVLAPTTVETSEHAVCALCHLPVSENVERFCRTHESRFGGKVYCFEHQKQVVAGGSR